jgi:hypothetical protein
LMRPRSRGCVPSTRNNKQNDRVKDLHCVLAKAVSAPMMIAVQSLLTR